MMEWPRCYMETWDCDLGRWTPQKGVRKGPYTLFGLRRALRALQEFGYQCDYQNGVGDPSVSVYRVDGPDDR